MSALARYLVIRGKAVLGYDRSASELTQELQNRGAQITHQTDPIRSWLILAEAKRPSLFGPQPSAKMTLG